MKQSQFISVYHADNGQIYYLNTMNGNMVEITSELCKDNDFQNPEKSLIQLCTMEELRKTIRSMEPGEREILILKYYSHMSNAQIAQRLNIKEGTVRVKLMRARQRLYN